MSRTHVGAALLVAAVLVATIIWFSTRDHTGTATGEVRATGNFGDYSLTLNECVSGEVDGFFGVWVLPEIDEYEEGSVRWKGGVRVVRTPSGLWDVHVEDPTRCEGWDCQARQLYPAQCDVYEIDVRETTKSINGIKAREGSARFACGDSGGTIEASITFEGCVGFTTSGGTPDG